MTISLRCTFIILVLLCLCISCAAYHARQTAKTSIIYAQREIVEEELLDVGIGIFTSSAIKDKKNKKQGTNPDVRNAEGHFIPYQLKNTFQQSSHWGMVRVIPRSSESADVLVQGEIIESNGENLSVKVTVSDAAGNIWFKKKYRATVDEEAYNDTMQGQKDAFQGLYNAIANDTATYMQKLSSEEIKNLRTISKMKFARDFAPDAFSRYLQQGRDGKLTLNRLPADDDPMIARILRIKERENMFLDTLNEYYEDFYDQMWPSYANWRVLNVTEREALAGQKRAAFTRLAGGALLVALAVALEIAGVHDSGALTGVMVVAGGQVFMNGINITKQAQMHYEALRELGESFGSEMKPIVLEFEGKQYELTGSAEEQYTRLRALLKEIYYAETGLAPAADSAE